MINSAFPAAWKRRWRRTIKNVGSKAIYSLDALFGQKSLIGDKIFFHPSDLPWTATLEARAGEIRTELEQVLAYRSALPAFHEISPDQKSITSDARWKTFFLVGFGRRSALASRLCPRTLDVLNAVPGLVTAFFSILGPHKAIPRHTGPYKGLVRYHLGLIVPDPPEKCTITVAGDTRHWAEGESLVFDDRHPHSVHNDTDQERVVLFVDVLRPLPPIFHALNRAVLQLVSWSPYVQDGVARQQAWERRFTASLPAPKSPASDAPRAPGSDPEIGIRSAKTGRNDALPRSGLRDHRG